MHVYLNSPEHKSMWRLLKTGSISRSKAVLLVLGLYLIIYVIVICSKIFTTNVGRSLFSDQDSTGRRKRLAPLMHQENCVLMPRWVNSVIRPKTPTDLTKWGYTDTVHCPRFTIDFIPTERQKVSLNCKTDASPRLVISVTNSTRDIDHVQFGDKCLEHVIDKCCTDDKPVPNVVHYVWYYVDKEFDFFDFVSFMSSLRFMKPCLILIHGDSVPHGKYWDYFVNISPNIIHVNRTKPTHVFGHKLAFNEHSSDVMRIEALLAYGGVYLDIDEILLQPLEPLRKYKYTMAYEAQDSMAVSLIMSKKNASFLDYWYDSYRNDYQPNWGHNSLQMPAMLAKKYPDLIHVSGFNFTDPGCNDIQMILRGSYDWRANYAMHLYLRFYDERATTHTDAIRTLNTTIGAICRHVLFGNKEMCI